MFDFNFLDIPEPFTFYLCNPNNEVMYELNGIDEESASLTINLNNQYDLSFDYFRYVNSSEDKLVESNGYHDLVVGMKILVDKIGYFKIKYPPMKFDGNKESKTINATSIDCELEDKDLVGFKINMGTPDSLEYLVTYDDSETESLINDYTGLPYDYIVFYNTYSEQLKTILGKYSDGTYTSSTAISEIKSFCDLIPRLRRKVITDSNGDMSIIEYVEYTYDSAGENITSIYLSGFNNRVSQLITFYQKYRDQLSLISLAIEKCNCNWKIGTIDESLVNKKFQFNVDGKNIYSFLTDDISSVANCVFYFNLFKREIDVVLAKNIGRDSGVVIDRHKLLNSLEVSCNSDNIYTRYNVSGGNNIDIKYVNFGSTRITDLSYFMNARNEKNERIYVSDTLAEKYNQYVSDRELARESYILLTKQYNQALTDIDDLKYKVPNDSVQNDWDTFTDAELEAYYKTYHQLLATLQSLYKEDYGSVGCNADDSINENYIRTTEYWYDYYAYKITIEQITATIHARAEGSRYADIDNETVLKKINAYKTEWSLYGTVELENKITAYNNNMQVLVDGEAIVLEPNSQEAKQWFDLTEEEKTEYGHYEGNYQYSVYMNLYNEKISCQSYLNQLNAKLEALESVRDATQANRNKLVKLVDIGSYNRAELKKLVPLSSSTISDTFTEEEIQIINLLYVDKNYSNENILTTSLDTTVSEIDVQYELLEDAKEQLSIESQPQISFNADIENLLVMSEFKDFDFEVGNFVSLEYYDDYYVDMRIVSMTFNPCVPEHSLSISFSNFIKSKSERTDVSDILGLAVGNSSSSSGSGSGGSSDNFGVGNDIDVTISNTMLSKLLNTEMFGTRVSNIILDTIKVNEITAKYAKFEGLAKGTTLIDGKCITTGYIIDQNYNGTNGNITNTKGSIINLETGKFNFGGGSLKYDGTALTVKGAIYADSGYIGGESGFTIAAGKIYSNGHGAYNTAKEGVYIGTDYISLGNGGVTYFKNDGTGKIGAWYVDANAIYRGSSSFGDSNGMYFGTSGLSIKDVFKVDSNGNLSIKDVFKVDSNGNLSIKDKFKVTSGGALTATEATITGDITATSLTLGSNVKINMSNIDGLSGTLNGIDSDLSNVIYKGDIKISTETMDDGTVKTTTKVPDGKDGYIENTTYTSADGNYVLTNVGLGGDDSGHFVKISKDGLLQATNAIIQGAIYATEGDFGGWTIGSDGIYSIHFNTSDSGIKMLSDGQILSKGVGYSKNQYARLYSGKWIFGLGDSFQTDGKRYSDLSADGLYLCSKDTILNDKSQYLFSVDTTNDTVKITSSNDNPALEVINNSGGTCLKVVNESCTYDNKCLSLAVKSLDSDGNETTGYVTLFGEGEGGTGRVILRPDQNIKSSDTENPANFTNSACGTFYYPWGTVSCEQLYVDKVAVTSDAKVKTPIELI
ncbi:MAG: hypothetical protein K2N51_18580 [Lachnospiraceae bacterium]|nr:hypothetical protein [Lachnospiraceae bacterium]